jgi:hypothetical protein
MTEEIDEKPTKALYEHCRTVFNAMTDAAMPEDGSEFLIYTGHLTRIFQEKGLAMPYYTAVMQTLKRMSCVEQLRRGGGNSQSKWRLVREPEESLFEAVQKFNKPRQGSLAAVEQQVAELRRRVDLVERAVGIIE